MEFETIQDYDFEKAAVFVFEFGCGRTKLGTFSLGSHCVRVELAQLQDFSVFRADHMLHDELVEHCVKGRQHPRQ